MENIEKNNKEIKDFSYVKKNYYELVDEKTKQEMFNFAQKYMTFINENKTEREITDSFYKMAKQNGFKDYDFGDKLTIGDKRIFINRNKGVVAFRIGKGDIEEIGMRIIVAHIDSPRIDIKQVPLYESDGLCFLKTHYYGGIKKYQWTAMPLALHGVVILKNGDKIEINIGEKDDDPVFYINDLLPHLGKSQMEQKANVFISGEQLNVVVGGMTVKEGENGYKIKSNILNILNAKYGMTEEDFLSAELSAVPALKARDVGFDRALIGGYGHDDRSCAYPAMIAMLEQENDINTNICILVDKEEIGSEGTTGIKSKVFEDIIEDICQILGKNAKKVRKNSICISADVTSGYDSNFPDVFEKNNSAILSCGVCMNKFSGAGGKSDSNDASAELVGKIRQIFAENNVVWQTAELGKVDIGGGGTVAKFIAELNIDTIDIGVPVISMHAPYELISKADLYSAFEAFRAFFK